MSEELYQPAERIIFHYYAGETKGLVKADPMVIWKRFMSVRGDFQGDYAVAFSPSKGAMEAHDALIKKIHMIFDVASYEEGGLTQGECIDLIRNFWAWCEGQKKKYEEYSDLYGGNIAYYTLALGRKPTYDEHFGFWLNLTRASNRITWAYVQAACIAAGRMTPSLEFFRSVTHGEGEAMLLKAQFEMSQPRGA